MRKIFIDPGHGGSDPGAVGGGMRESDITLEVSKFLAVTLERAGLEVMLSRTQDTTVSINERWQAANNWGTDLFVSVHVNAGGGTGVETLIPTASPNNPNRDLRENRRLAEIVSLSLANAFGMRLRRANGVMLETETRHGTVGVLRHTRMLSIMPELAFIDSPPHNPDLDVLRNRRREAAEALAKGVCSFFGVEIPKGNEQESGLHNGQQEKARGGLHNESQDKTHNKSQNNSEVEEVRFNTLGEVPEWARPTIERLIDFCECRNLPRGVLTGNNSDGTGLDLSLDMVRTFVVLDRAGVFGGR